MSHESGPLGTVRTEGISDAPVQQTSDGDEAARLGVPEYRGGSEPAGPADPLQSEYAVRLDLANAEAEEDLEAEVLKDEAEEAAENAWKADVASGAAVTEEKLLGEARRRLYAKLDQYGPKDLLLVYVRGLALEEQRLKTALRRKDKDTTLDDFRKKAGNAIRGAGGRVDDALED